MADGTTPNADPSQGDAQKRQKLNEGPTANGVNGQQQSADSTAADTMLQSARAAAAFIPFLSPEELLPPKMPSREEMESVLLDLRKKALVQEYFGD